MEDVFFFAEREREKGEKALRASVTGLSVILGRSGERKSRTGNVQKIPTHARRGHFSARLRGCEAEADVGRWGEGEGRGGVFARGAVTGDVAAG